MANLRADNLTGTGGRNAITGSVLFNSGSSDAENSYLKVTTTSDLALGTGDFTIETWVYFTSIGTYQSIIDFREANGLFPFLVRDTDGDLYYYVDGSVLINNIPARANNCWHHVAVVRSSGTTKIYLNGKEEGSASDSSNYVATNNPYIGGSTARSNDLFGYLSNFRIVKGTAVYTAAFTPPTEKLTAIDGTVLLCCQDSDDPTQEATGKTITGFGNLDITQTEKINGRFSGDPASNGWTVHSGASASYANGQWTVTSPAQIWSGASTSFTSVVGQQYRITAVVVTSNNWGSVSVANGGQSAAKIVYAGWSGGGTFPLTVNKIFTATATTTHVSIDNLNTTNATVTTVQYVSVKPVEVGKASKVLPSVGIDEGVVFDGDTKVNTQGYMYFPTGDTSQRGRGRAVIGWANNPVNTGMDYFSIQSMGNSISFGTLTSGNRWGSHALSSSTRGLFVGGYINTPASTFYNTIDYVTIATSSNPTDFGDVTTASYRSGCCSSSTRGIIALGYVAPAFGKVNTIDQVTIATTGNATNFGDTSETRANFASTSSPTRGVFAGGVTPSNVNTIDYVTIATAGDATNFGDLQAVVDSPMAMASTTRGIIGGGYPSPANTNIINYITIASTGDATDFGDLTGLYSVGSATSNSIRGVFCGGYTSPSKHNLMEFITIATTGNASDFGDMLYSRRDFGACSDSHGGL